MADANVPGIGKMPKWAIIATVAGGGLIVFWVWRNHSANAAAASTTPTTTSSSTGIDPTTGYPYGSIQDQEALAGSISSNNLSGLSAGYPAGNGTTTTYGSSSTPTTNAAWAQNAVQVMSALDFDPETVAGAIGAYLGRIPLTSAQASLMQTILGQVGTPPQGSYSIVTQPPSGGGGNGSGGGGTTTSPTAPTSAPSGFSITPHTGFADFGWSQVSGATGYELLVEGVGGKGTGTSHVDSHMPGTHAERVHLAPGRYKSQVRANNSAGSGPWTSDKTFTVK